MGRRYLNLFGNKLCFGGTLFLSLWRVPKALVMNQRCTIGGPSLIVIKHGLCKNTITYSVGRISHVWKTSLSSLSCLCSPVLCGRLQDWDLSLPDMRPPLGDSWGLKTSQNPPQSSFSLNELGKPFLASSLPGCCRSSWPKQKSQARLGFSVDFIDNISYGFFLMAPTLIVWIVSFPIFWTRFNTILWPQYVIRANRAFSDIFFLLYFTL